MQQRPEVRWPPAPQAATWVETLAEEWLRESQAERRVETPIEMRGLPPAARWLRTIRKTLRRHAAALRIFRKTCSLIYLLGAFGDELIVRGPGPEHCCAHSG